MKFIGLLTAIWLTVGCAIATAAVSPWVDFNIVNGFVVIPTEIEGIQGHSVIDTGAQVTAIAESFVKKHNLQFAAARPITIHGVNGSELRSTYKDVPVTLMGTKLVFKQVVDLKLDDRVQLFIGADFLRTLYFQFDYPNQRIRAISRDAFDLKKISNVKSKVDKVTKQPMVKVRLNDEFDTWLVIDTGNSGGLLLDRGLATKRQWLKKFQTERIQTRGAISSAGMDMFRLPLIELGPFNVRNARVSVPLAGKRLQLLQRSRAVSERRSKIKGLLGYDVLKNFLVTFDYRSGSMFVEIP